MDKRQQRTLQSFENVLVFVEQHPIKPAIPLLSRTVLRLRELKRRINELTRGQRDVRIVPGGEAHRVRNRITRIRREMMVLVRIATPHLRFAAGEAALRVPHARASAETVANAAVSLADALAPHEELLLDAGYTREYLRKFRAQALAVAEWEKDAIAARNERSIATRDIAEAFKEGMVAVTVIEGLVMRAYADEPEMMRLWEESATRVEADWATEAKEAPDIIPHA